MSDVDVLIVTFPVFGLGLRGVLEDRGRSALVIDDVTAVGRWAAASRPAVVVVDVGLPGAGAAVSRLLEAAEAPAVVVLGDESDDELLLTAACAGAVGVLPRSVTPDAAMRAFEAAERGESLLPRRLVPRVVAALRVQAAGAVEQSYASVLTGKERQVLAMMRTGLSTSAIAEQLFVAPVTVRTHVCAIRRKLRLEAVDDPHEVRGHLRIS